jgi:hypothetical protein
VSPLSICCINQVSLSVLWQAISHLCCSKYPYCASLVVLCRRLSRSSKKERGSTAVEFVDSCNSSCLLCKSGSASVVVCMWYHHEAQRLLLACDVTTRPLVFLRSCCCTAHVQRMDDRMRNFDHTTLYSHVYFEWYRKCVKPCAHEKLKSFLIVKV